MHKVSLRVQKFISFIPCINILIFFIWMYNYYSYYRIGLDFTDSTTVMIKSIFIVFACSIPIMILTAVLTTMVPASVLLLAAIAVYVQPLIMSWALIKYQEKLDNEGL